MKARGRSGAVQAGGREAARLGAWSLESDEGGGHALSGEMVWRDVFWLERGPHTVRLRLSTREWVWRGAEIATDGDTLRAELATEPDVEECG